LFLGHTVYAVYNKQASLMRFEAQQAVIKHSSYYLMKVIINEYRQSQFYETASANT
jgi:hypothetical protein